ncbi:hypothetical protein ACH5RR_030173 [Cinchona calisaya]|uniref:Uncharacterized protein n=1 Tax=Cinchona calisaya TaxID=153742 RepID=A0ABD2YX32_9GENT
MGENGRYSEPSIEASEVGEPYDGQLVRAIPHPTGPLYKRFSEGLLRSFAFSNQATVAEFIQNGQWQWPKGRKCNVELKQLMS